jgi:predicted NBD/HSP70 family sugar kinase
MLADRPGTVARSRPTSAGRDVAVRPDALARTLDAVAPARHRHQLGVYNDVNAITFGELDRRRRPRRPRPADWCSAAPGLGGGVVTDGAADRGRHQLRRRDRPPQGGARRQRRAAARVAGRGCVEAYVGGAALLARIHRELAAGACPAVVAAAGGVAAAHPGHVDDAAATEPWADALWTACADDLALALGHAITLLNPDRLVLGGGVLAGAPRLRARTVAALDALVPEAHRRPLTITAAELGDDAGWIGAAHLAARGVSLV